jgi:asparagine synthase (glutamine-hydrolysing)
MDGLSGRVTIGTIADLGLLRAQATAHRAAARSALFAPGGGLRISWDGVLAVILLGELFGDLTVFDGAPESACTPGDSSNGPAEERGAAGDRVGLRSAADLLALYSEYDELLRRAVQSLPESASTVMGLSGGRDSRHILLAVGSCGRPLPRLVSSRHYLSGAGGADVAAAQMLADRFGVALRVVSQPGDRFRQEWDKNRITGLRTLSHSWGLVLAEALKGPEVLLDGMNGGVLFGRAGLQRSVLKRFGRGQPRFAGLREHVLSELVDRPVGSVGAWLPQRLARREVVEGIRQRLSDCFAQYERFENPVQAFLCWEHVQHNTRLFTYGMMENDCVVCPLDTVEMVRFALSLPWEVSCDAAFQERAIAFRYPSFGDVPFSEGVDRSPGGWLADSPGEAASWRSIRDVLQPHLSAGGLSALEATRHQLGVVQKSTLLAQALYWEEHGCIPESAVFFGDTSCGATRNDVDA